MLFDIDSSSLNEVECYVQTRADSHSYVLQRSEGVFHRIQQLRIELHTILPGNISEILLKILLNIRSAVSDSSPWDLHRSFNNSFPAQHQKWEMPRGIHKRGSQIVCSYSISELSLKGLRSFFGTSIQVQWSRTCVAQLFDVFLTYFPEIFVNSMMSFW